MKNSFYFFVFFFILPSHYYASGIRADRESYIKDKVIQSQAYVEGKEVDLSDKDIKKPSWINQESGFIEFDNRDYFWVKGLGISKYLDMAKQSAIISAKGILATSLKDKIYYQFVDAFNSQQDKIGNETMARFRESISASKVRVEVSGLLTLDSFKHQVAYLKSVDKKFNPELGNTIWKYYVRVGIPYSYYKELRDKFLAEAMDKENPRVKDLAEKARKIIDKLDEK